MMKDILQKLFIGVLALGLIPALWGFSYFAFAAGPLNNTSQGVNAADDPVVWTGTHTNTSQPCFLAYNSAGDSDQTGAGAAATVDFDAEIFDQGANFASDAFTAPVTGRYQLIAQVTLLNITAAADDVELVIVTSNRSYSMIIINTDNLPTLLAIGRSVIADMDTDDTATVTIEVNGEASDVVDIAGDSIFRTSFSGCLIS